MVNRHTYQASTAELLGPGVVWQQARPEENRSLWKAVQIPAEISEAHLRVDMAPETPIPPSSELQVKGDNQ